MADILIRGMEMPKYTTKAEFGIDADGNPLCMVYHENGTEPDIYNVIPLTEGLGRLIDADTLLLDAGSVYEVWGDGFATFGFSREQIENAHTIVPAEGGGEDG